MELRNLQLFCDLVETRSFSRAAERSFMSQSAVSQRLNGMERELGQSLMERGKGKGRVAPTEAGWILFEGARSLLREAEDLEARLRGITDEVAGTVRVTTVYSVGLHMLPKKMKPFIIAHPRVNIHLEYSQTGKVYQDVLSGQVDVGIVACPTSRSGIELIPFGEEEMVFICAPENPMASHKEVHLSELENLPFITFVEESPTRRLIDDSLKGAGVKVKNVMTFDNIETIRNMVEIGSGVSLAPAETTRMAVAEGMLAAIPLAAEDAFVRPVGLLLKKAGTRRVAVRAFVEAMKSDKNKPVSVEAEE